MIKGKLLNKKSAVIAFLLALCMSLTAFAFGRTIARADDLEKVDDKPTENVMLDMDGTQSWLEVDGAKVGSWTDTSDTATRTGNIHKVENATFWSREKTKRPYRKILDIHCPVSTGSRLSTGLSTISTGRYPQKPVKICRSKVWKHEK